MKIAICCETDNADGLVAADFQRAAWLLLVDTEKEAVYDAVRKQDEENLLFAAKIIDEKCEAVICGPIEKAPFEIMANAGVSRFDGSGRKAQRAYIRFRRNQLPLIRDYIGGPGPVGHSHDFSCHEHGDEEDEALAAALEKVGGGESEREEDTLFVLSDEDAELLPDELEIPDGLSRDEIEKFIQGRIDATISDLQAPEEKKK